jgi:hypothetical protein
LWSAAAAMPRLDHRGAQVGRRSREWTAVGQTEIECVREMARCLGVIGDRGVPK